MSAPVLLISALAALARAPIPAALEVGVPALEAAAAPVVPFAAIALDPERFLGSEVRLFVQYHSERASWNPYMTRFAPSFFRAVVGWSDEQRLWLRPEHDSPAVSVFVRRGSEADVGLVGAQIHERWMLTGVVREVFLGRPWIEITHARAMRSHTPEGSVLHAIRALEFVDREAFAIARDEFTRALAAPLPAHVARELEAWRSRCTERLEAAARPASARRGPGAPR